MRRMAVTIVLASVLFSSPMARAQGTLNTLADVKRAHPKLLALAAGERDPDRNGVDRAAELQA